MFSRDADLWRSFSSVCAHFQHFLHLWCSFSCRHVVKFGFDIKHGCKIENLESF